MKQFIFSILFFFFIPSLLIAQTNPFGMVQAPGSGMYNFVQVDVQTGNASIYTPIPGMTAFVIPDQSIIDFHRNHYVFNGFAGSNKTVYTINLANNMLISSIAFPQNVLGFQYHCIDSMIYGLYEFSNNYELVTIHPDSGTISSISSITSALTAYTGGTFVLDPVQNLYSFVAQTTSGLRMYAFDTQSGTLVHDNPWSANVVGQVYNAADSTIYGVLEVGSDYTMVSVNVTNGTFSTIGVLNGVTPGFFSDATCISQNGTYVFRGFNSGNNPAIFTVNPATAAVLSSTPMSDNVSGLELPACTSGIPVSTGPNLDSDFIKLYPNPFQDYLYVNTQNILSDQIEITIYSIEGQAIIKEVIASSENTEVSVDVSQLNAGLYFIRLEFQDKIFSRKILKN